MTILLVGVSLDSAKGSVILCHAPDTQRLVKITADPQASPGREAKEYLRGVSDRSSDMSTPLTGTYPGGGMPCADSLWCQVLDSHLVRWLADDNSLLRPQTEWGCLERPPERNHDL